MKARKRKCKVCREWFMPFNSMQPVCATSGCALEWSRQVRRKEAKKEKRAGRLKIETLGQACVKAQEDVNRYVRTRDFGKGCISCASPRIDDAGHLFPIGTKYRCSRIRLDPNLIMGQCSKCNRYTGGGNRAAYEAGVIDRYGEARLAAMYARKEAEDHGLLAPLTKEEVRQIAAEHRRMTRELERSRN